MFKMNSRDNEREGIDSSIFFDFFYLCLWGLLSFWQLV